jgi:sporulation protein YlmC with PRC-barrel domain
MWGDDSVRISELLYKEVYVEDLDVGKVVNVLVDPEEWKVTHLEVELRKEASQELLGAKKSFKNILAISAVEKGTKWRSDRGIELQVSKGQLHIYLRPP